MWEAPGMSQPTHIRPGASAQNGGRLSQRWLELHSPWASTSSDINSGFLRIGRTKARTLTLSHHEIAYSPKATARFRVVVPIRDSRIGKCAFLYPDLSVFSSSPAVLL